MTIDKAADKMKCLKYKVLQGAIIVHDTYSDDYELLNESALTALGMAIASLEAWGKIKKEIEHKKFRTMEVQISDAHLGFNGGLECALAIIDKHLQEVTTDEQL